MENSPENNLVQNMNILVLTSLFPNHLNPDFGVFVKNRMISVARLQGCHVVVMAPVPYCPPWKILGKWYGFSQVKPFEIIEGVEVYHPRYLLIPKISMLFHGLSMMIFSTGLFRRLHQRYRFDLIDAHYIYPDGFAGALMGRLYRLPVIVSARGTDINDFPRFRSIRPFIKWTLSSAWHVISVCNALRDAMISLGCNLKKINVIPNGINIDRFYMASREETRNGFQLNNKGKIILSVGGLIERKGHHLTIEAMKKIVQKIPDVHLYIAGKGEKENELKNQTVENGLKEYVTFLEHVPNHELALWYNAADVFCLASSREGWANVIMESMACGTPVVATNVWGAPEIITDSKVGILVERNVDSIANGLIDALKKNWNRQQIMDHVSKRTWNVVANEVKDVFEKVLRESAEK